MSVRSAQSVTTEFTTSRFDTGAITTADSLPTGTLYVNGTANAATVTVTNQATGIYKAQVTLPTLAVNDVVSIVILATVNSVAGGGKIWEDTKDVFAGAIPDVVAGGSGGLFIAGSNAATTIAGLTTGALSCTTITASGAVAFQSTFAVTGTTTLTGNVSLGGTLGVTGTVTFNAFTVTNNMLVSGNSTVTGTTTRTGAVSFGSTFGVTGTTTLAAVNTGAISGTTLTFSGAVAFQSTFIVTGATTFTGAITATNGSNNITGVSVSARIKKNTALAAFPFKLKKNGAFVDVAVATLTAKVNIDGAGWVAVTSPGTLTGQASGGYTIDLAAADLNGNCIMFLVTGSTVDPELIFILTSP